MCVSWDRFMQRRGLEMVSEDAPDPVADFQSDYKTLKSRVRVE